MFDALLKFPAASLAFTRNPNVVPLSSPSALNVVAPVVVANPENDVQPFPVQRSIL